MLVARVNQRLGTIIFRVSQSPGPRLVLRDFTISFESVGGSHQMKQEKGTRDCTVHTLDHSWPITSHITRCCSPRVSITFNIHPSRLGIPIRTIHTPIWTGEVIRTGISVGYFIPTGYNTYHMATDSIRLGAPDNYIRHIITYYTLTISHHRRRLT
ncbi:hypothetical protein AMATHDRAFT_57105 [Amanita thiersii Skay4041]|uniref:Uncharacterized protein n=1 Tax=Amanita thiersii Skay4041 TaxID=703135 RepID=A0A2A9NW04_9AGAR|nr:hypothetical protein AMATHDRAFT_57105 [Amanita thiersii Skay4041]